MPRYTWYGQLASFDPQCPEAYEDEPYCSRCHYPIDDCMCDVDSLYADWSSL